MGTITRGQPWKHQAPPDQNTLETVCEHVEVSKETHYSSLISENVHCDGEDRFVVELGHVLR